MKISALSQRLRRLPRWFDMAWLGLILAGFAGVWAISIGLSSIDFDEAFSAYIAQFNILEIAYYTALDVHPPLYYIALHFWSLAFGDSVAVLRFMSVIWGMGALVFAFLLVRRGFGRQAAWLATPLLAASPLFFHYSGIMRMYSMAMAISMAATYVLVRLTAATQPKSRTRLWILYGILVSLGMWTNYFTALVWLAHAGWLLFDQYRGMRLRQFAWHTGWAKSMLIAVGLFLPWSPALLFRFAEVQVSGFWIKPISVDTLPSTLTMSTLYQSSSQTKGWWSVLLIGGFLLFSVYLWRLLSQGKGRQVTLLRLLLLTSIVPVALLIVMSLPPLASSYVYRYLLPALGVAALLLGVVIALARIKKHALIKKGALYVLALGMFISGCVHSVIIGDQNLDSGKVTLISQIIPELAATTGDTPVLTWSPYTYYVAAAYEQPGRPIYLAHNQSLETIGSLKMLADHAKDRSITDVAAFARAHGSIWILAEDKTSTEQSPVPGWRQARSIKLTDPVTGKQPAIAIEYRP